MSLQIAVYKTTDDKLPDVPESTFMLTANDCSKHNCV